MQRFLPELRGSAYRGCAVAAVGLAALLLLTWGLRAWRTDAVREHAARRRAEAVSEAASYVSEQFEALQRDLSARAEQVAEAPVVVRALRRQQQQQQQQQGRGRGVEALVRYCAGLQWSERLAAEVYDPAPHLLAWQGLSLPLDDAPEALRFLEAPQTVIAGDAGARKALVAWQPVRDGGRTVGAVRVLRVVRFRAPVQNQYLQNYNLAERWRRATGQALSLSYGPTPPRDTSPETEVYPLKSLAGETLGHVSIRAPAEGRLVQATRARYNGWMSLWAVLLLGVGVVVLWRRYARLLRRTGDAPAPRRLLRLAGRFLPAALAWVGLRYVLLELNVPARWVDDAGALAPLFDPARLASTAGGGALRSTGDLLISGIFVFVLAVAFLRFAARFWSEAPSLGALREQQRARNFTRPSPMRLVGSIAVLSALSVGLVAGLATLVRRAVLDSTFDFFARTGLLPSPLVLVVFCALLLFAGAVLVGMTGLAAVGRWAAARYTSARWPRAAWIAAALVAGAAPLGAVCALVGAQTVFAWWPVPIAFGAAALALVGLGMTQRAGRFELLTLRRLLPLILLLAVLLYPMLYDGMRSRRRARLRDAASSFGTGGDPRVLFSLEQVLREARSKPALRSLLKASEAPPPPQALDSLGASLLRGALLSSLGAYDVNLTLFDSTGRPLGQYAPGSGPPRSASRGAEFELLRLMYRENGARGPFVTQMTGWPTPERFQYAGLAPLRSAPTVASGAPSAASGAPPPPAIPDTTSAMGWLVLRAVPQAFRPGAGTPFPRALLPDAYYADLYTEVALAEFQDGSLVRNLGRDFGRVRLPHDVQKALAADSVLWRTEDNEGRPSLTFYRRQATSRDGRASFSKRRSVAAVRVPAVTTFDHLYYALRLVIAGFLVAAPLYLLGLAARYRAGLLPAPQVRFRDKVLNAFLGVGAVSVVVVGLVGLRVLTVGNERSTQRRLRQRLEQVEETLAMSAEREEPLYQAARRIGLDTLAARAGVDLNLYRRHRLVASSRPRLVEEHLIDRRLPIDAYRALYFQGYQFAATQEKVGRFPYTVGFRALTDAQGRPRYVLSVPTLREQERIEEEQSRTVAYLFGALLLLILVVMVTAVTLAGALTRPLRRIRAGLEAVGKGEFARALPTGTRDEIGELAATFNAMRDQLAESRRKLAQQEREMAWREMARQVAHEIKNPLTPMKLSVQHLRRAFEGEDALQTRPAGTSEEKERERETAPGSQVENGAADGFRTLFERITSTLVEQIDTLTRIANEFSSFARLPTRVTEPLDLSETVEKAAALMREEAEHGDIRLHLAPEPLVVEADAEELRRLYINLIKNALQAVPEGRAGRVEVATMRRDGRARSTVADNGSGIPPELREKIFQPNFSTKTSGTGLGLAIAKKSVEELGGDIGFETEEGKGTTFWIELPLEE